MIEINGKFKKWLKEHGHSPDKIKNITHEHEIDSLNGMGCVEIIKYMESLISVHGESATYGEHWIGYEDFCPVVEVSREETGEEYEERITSLRERYDREVFVKSREYTEECEKYDAQIKALQEKLNNLKGSHARSTCR